MFKESRFKYANWNYVFRKPLFIIRTAAKLFRKRAFGKDFLRGISFATTYECNFKCSHCYALHFRKETASPLTLHEKIAVIREAKSIGAVSVDFVGGEIGISLEFEKILSNIPVSSLNISLQSNGYQMTKERVLDLKSMGVDKIGISIDSGLEEEHDAFRRQKGSYQRCFQALDNIRDAGLNSCIITCVTKGDTRNESFKRLVEYAIKHKIQLVFSAVIPFGEFENNTDILCDEDDFMAMAELHKKYPFLTRDNYENLGSLGCPAAKQVMYISEYGDVMPCAFMHITFGNIRNESLRSIRDRMLNNPYLKDYHPLCWISEDKDFIKHRIPKMQKGKDYPANYSDIFDDVWHTYKPAFLKKPIQKVFRSCPLCGSRRSHIVTSGREHEFNNTTDDLFIVVECGQCALVYLNPRPDETMIDQIYPENYYCHKEAYSSQAQNTSLIAKFKRKLIESIGYPRQVRDIFNIVDKPKTKLRVLDVGCGNGDALDAFRNYSPFPVETVGLDYDENALNIVQSKGHEIISGTISEVKIVPNTFDIVYSSNVIEHVADPAGMLQTIYEVIKPGGIFICETPNFKSLDVSLFSKSGHWGGYHFPRHWTFFTEKTFRRMAKGSGFAVIEVKYKPIPMFWIWTGHSYVSRGLGRPDLADKLFPILESKKNIFYSMGLKIGFTVIDFLQLIIWRKTSLMSVYLHKP
jgi:MoaA/NifB/PqqE/SkfB family radical SAM enzyme/ubiquinone/menaquinone biosynthesis C-methylase UbiE